MKEIIEVNDKGEYFHWCQGCNQLHMINTLHKNDNGAIWSFNGNLKKPTFNPSINIVGQCHYFLRDGMLIFCNDSRHKLAGQTVPLIKEPD
jgi:hypothetical protein